jgi:hypothetical protein
LPAARDVDGFELAALDTLQHRLPRHAERADCLAMGRKPSPASPLKRAFSSSVRRMRQGAPGVICSRR